jgi:transcriptional regulator with XRE-family HTH domain
MPRGSTVSNAAYVRAARPDDLHPLLKEVHEKWLASGMPLNEIAAQIGVSQSTMYGWFMGRGVPDLRKIDAMCELIGYRLTVTRGTRRPNVT